MYLQNGFRALRAALLGNPRRRPSRRRRQLSECRLAQVELLEDRTLLSAAPVAALSGPASIDEGDTLSLDASGSYDPDGMPPFFAWDLNNDGSFSDASGEPSLSLAWMDLSSYGIDGPGSYTVLVQVDDGMDGSDTAAHTFSVENVAPSIWSAGLDSTSVMPGQPVSFSASFGDALPGAYLDYTLDWGDGTAPETGSTADMFNSSHSYDTPGDYTVSFSVDDGDGGLATWSDQLTVNGLTPSVSGPASVNEGDFYTLSLSADGMVDQWEIDWGDGNSDMLGGYESQASHNYADDDPTGTSSDQYTINVTAVQGGNEYDADPLQVTVENVAPAIDSASLQYASNFPGDNITLTAGFFDPAQYEDEFSYSIDWGDGTPADTGNLFDQSLDVSHAYDTPGDYTVTLTIGDDDTGEATWSEQLTINGLTPSVSGPSSVNEGDSYTLSLSADGMVDQWEIDWGDGNSEMLGGYESQATHNYADDDPTGTSSDQYTINVTASYNGYEETADPLQVTVQNVAPAIDSASLDYASNFPGDSITLTAGFFDPAQYEDEFSYTVDWGDGTPADTGNLFDQSLDASHAYDTPGDYTVTLTIGDDDTGEATWSEQLTIIPPPNMAPEAADDTTSTQLDIAVSISVLDNDSDPDPDDFISLLDVDAISANGGMVSFDSGTQAITYTPASGYGGDDSFQYTIQDSQGATATATVYLTVEPAAPNTSPAATDDNANTAIDTQVTISVLDNDNDPDAGDTISVVSVDLTSANGGTVGITPGMNTIDYTPAAGFSGSDTFEYTIQDEQGATATATVFVSVEIPEESDEGSDEAEEPAFSYATFYNPAIESVIGLPVVGAVPEYQSQEGVIDAFLMEFAPQEGDFSTVTNAPVNTVDTYSEEESDYVVTTIVNSTVTETATPGSDGDWTYSRQVDSDYHITTEFNDNAGTTYTLVQWGELDYTYNYSYDVQGSSAVISWSFTQDANDFYDHDRDIDAVETTDDGEIAQDGHYDSDGEQSMQLDASGTTTQDDQQNVLPSQSSHGWNAHLAESYDSLLVTTITSPAAISGSSTAVLTIDVTGNYVWDETSDRLHDSESAEPVSESYSLSTSGSNDFTMIEDIAADEIDFAPDDLAAELADVAPGATPTQHSVVDSYFSQAFHDDYEYLLNASYAGASGGRGTADYSYNDSGSGNSSLTSFMLQETSADGGGDSGVDVTISETDSASDSYNYSSTAAGSVSGDADTTGTSSASYNGQESGSGNYASTVTTDSAYVDATEEDIERSLISHSEFSTTGSNEYATSDASSAGRAGGVPSGISLSTYVASGTGSYSSTSNSVAKVEDSSEEGQLAVSQTSVAGSTVGNSTWESTSTADGNVGWDSATQTETSTTTTTSQDESSGSETLAETIANSTTVTDTDPTDDKVVDIQMDDSAVTNSSYDWTSDGTGLTVLVLAVAPADVDEDGQISEGEYSASISVTDDYTSDYQELNGTSTTVVDTDATISLEDYSAGDPANDGLVVVTDTTDSYDETTTTTWTLIDHGEHHGTSTDNLSTTENWEEDPPQDTEETAETTSTMLSSSHFDSSTSGSFSSSSSRQLDTTDTDPDDPSRISTSHIVGSSNSSGAIEGTLRDHVDTQLNAEGVLTTTTDYDGFSRTEADYSTGSQIETTFQETTSDIIPMETDDYEAWHQHGDAGGSSSGSSGPILVGISTTTHTAISRDYSAAGTSITEDHTDIDLQVVVTPKPEPDDGDDSDTDDEGDDYESLTTGTIVTTSTFNSLGAHLSEITIDNERSSQWDWAPDDFVTISAASNVADDGQYDHSYLPNLGAQVSGSSSTVNVVEEGQNIITDSSTAVSTTYHADGSTDYVIDTNRHDAATLNTVTTNSMNSEAAESQFTLFQVSTADNQHDETNDYSSQQHRYTDVDPVTGEEVELEDSTTEVSTDSSRISSTVMTGFSHNVSSGDQVNVDITNDVTSSESENFSSSQYAVATIDEHADGTATTTDFRTNVASSTGSSDYHSATETDPVSGESGSTFHSGDGPQISLSFSVGSTAEWSVADSITYDNGAIDRDLTSLRVETNESSTSHESDPADPHQSVSGDFSGNDQTTRLETIDSATDVHRIEINGTRHEEWSSDNSFTETPGFWVDNSLHGHTDETLAQVKTGDYDPQTGLTGNWSLDSYSLDRHTHVSSDNQNGLTGSPTGGDFTHIVQTEADDHLVGTGSGTEVTHTLTRLHESDVTHIAGGQTTTEHIVLVDSTDTTPGDVHSAHETPDNLTPAGDALEIIAGQDENGGPVVAFDSLTALDNPSATSTPRARNVAAPTDLANAASEAADEARESGSPAQTVPSGDEPGLTNFFGQPLPGAEPVEIVDAECGCGGEEEPPSGDDPGPGESIVTGIYKDASGDVVGTATRRGMMYGFSVDEVTRHGITISLADVEAFDNRTPNAGATEWNEFFRGFANGKADTAFTSQYPDGSDGSAAYRAGYYAGIVAEVNEEANAALERLGVSISDPGKAAALLDLLQRAIKIRQKLDYYDRLEEDAVHSWTTNLFGLDPGDDEIIADRDPWRQKWEELRKKYEQAGLFDATILIYDFDGRASRAADPRQLVREFQSAMAGRQSPHGIHYAAIQPGDVIPIGLITRTAGKAIITGGVRGATKAMGRTADVPSLGSRWWRRGASQGVGDTVSYSMRNVRKRWWSGKAPVRSNPAMPRGREYMELSHTYISNNGKFGKYIPDSIKNRGWNLKPMWGTQHALVDSQRYRFMSRVWKNENALRSPVMGLWGRMPISHRIGAGVFVVGGGGYVIYDCLDEDE